jgi:hypothetical protein
MSARRFAGAHGRGAGARGSSGVLTPLQVLLAAPGADAFFDADDLTRITKDGSEKVSLLGSRIGAHTVEQGTSGNQPTWGATSPSGRRGITFVTASSHRLVDPLTTLGALYDGVQPYSALWVVKLTSATANQAVWSVGDSGSSANSIMEGANSSSQSTVIRTATAGTTNAGGTVTTNIACFTSLFTGSAQSLWINGVNAINAASNTRSPTCDQLVIGARRNSGAFGLFLGAEFYGLILSRTQWSASERQALEAAARVYWGTP